VGEILERLRQCAANEANLLLRTFREKGDYLTDISEKISERINQFTYQLLDYLENSPLPDDPKDPLIKHFLSYALPTLTAKFRDRLLSEIPEHHKKAIISCHLAAQLVYRKGLDWHPTIVDILPVLLKQQL
jgi:glutamate dehydrogenase